MVTKTYGQVFPFPGIFRSLGKLGVPWKDEKSASDLEIALLFRCYHKPVTSMVQSLMTGDVLTEDEMDRIARMIFSIHGLNWVKMWNTQNFTYNPIENYDMTETETSSGETSYGKTSTRTDNLQASKGGTETRTPNLQEVLEHGKIETRTDSTQHIKTGTDENSPNITETTTPDLTTKTDGSLYGFNSQGPVKSDSREEKSSGNTQNIRTGTETTTYNTTESNTGTVKNENTGADTTKQTGTESVEYDTVNKSTGTQAFVDGGKDNTRNSRSLSRKGNIGVTTTQQMIEQERNSWMWNYFYDVVFPDIINTITLPIY